MKTRAMAEPIKLRNAANRLLPSPRCDICDLSVGFVCEACDAASNLFLAARTIEDQQARISELGAIVNQLPKTADGVPITPCMNIATVDGVNFGGVIRDDVGVLTIESVAPEECIITLRSIDGEEWHVRPDDLYSTIEAARAANQVPGPEAAR